MTWFEAVPAGAMALAVFFVPGTAILLAGRLPWLPSVCAAPAASVAVAATGAVVAERIGVAWGLLPLGVSTAAFVIIAAALGWLIRAPRAAVFPNRTAATFAVVGVVVAAPIAIIPFALGMGAPDSPPQTWDAVFHLNALQYIADTGNASTLTLGTVSAPERSEAFYPAGWHDIVSSIVGTSSIPVAANMGSLVILGFVWPAGLALLASVVFPVTPAASLIAPVIGSCFAAFPARMLSYGTLWPTALSTALLPAIIALAVLFLAPGLVVRSRIQVIVAGVLATAGAAVAHPTAVFAAVVLTAPYVLWRSSIVLRRWWRTGRHRLAVAAPTASVIVFAAVAFALLQSRALSGVLDYPRPQLSTHAQAIGEALFDSTLGATGYGSPDAFWLIGVATIAGFVLLATRPAGRWLCVSFAISVALYALAMGPDGLLRGLVGPWYKDPVRLGGLVPLFASLLATSAVVRLASSISQRFLTTRGVDSSARRVRAAAASTVVLLILFIASTGAGGAERRQSEAARDYRSVEGGGGFLVTPSELAMVERLPNEVPPDETIIGNPFNGSAYAYALADREVVFRHVNGNFGEDRLYLGRNFNRINTDPRVCEFLEEFGVTYFYDDSDLYAGASPSQAKYVGLTASGITSGLDEVDSGDRATLYRITACDP